MKGAIIGIVGLLSFLLVMLGVLHLTGNLTQANLYKLIGKKTEEELKKEAKEEDISPLARALRLREEELKKREERVVAGETRIKKRQADLEELQKQIMTIQTQITQSMESQDADKAKRANNVAMSLSKMKPSNAAKSLNDWPPEDAAAALGQMKEKERGKILDAMDPGKSALVLQAMQQSKSS